MGLYCYFLCMHAFPFLLYLTGRHNIESKVCRGRHTFYHGGMQRPTQDMWELQKYYFFVIAILHVILHCIPVVSLFIGWSGVLLTSHHKMGIAPLWEIYPSSGLSVVSCSVQEAVWREKGECEGQSREGTHLNC